MAAQGLAVRFWCPPRGVCVDLPAAQIATPGSRRRPAAALARQLARLGFVLGGVDYTEDLCQRPARATDSAGAQASARSVAKAITEDADVPATDTADADSPPSLPPGLLDVVCFSQGLVPAVEDALGQLGIPVLAKASTKLRVGWAGDPSVLRNLPGVKLVGPARLPQLLFIDQLRRCIGQGAAAAAPAGHDGQGEVIAISDSGLDSGNPSSGMHADFSGRIRALESLPLNPSWLPFAVDASSTASGTSSSSSDDAADRGPKGHGTHVAGLAVGSGASSSGAYGGIAPAAELVFFALEREVRTRPEVAGQLPPGFYLAGRPIDLRELLTRGQQHGAWLHNLSWGDPAAGAYTDDCHEADLYLSREPQAVVVCAAGNDGTDRNGNRQLDAGSLYAPATAKNVIAVGATEGPLDASLGRGSRAVWGDFDRSGRRWAASADRNDPVSGEPARIAPISSTGPTADGRVKPDLCAPGTNLVSTRSQHSAAQGWGLASPLPLYMYNGGTSMAAPVVTAALAVLRQAWRTARRSAPSGIALKALLLLGTLPVQGRQGNTATPFEAGLGRLDLAGSLPSESALARIGWRVSLRDSAALKVETGQHRDLSLHLPEAQRLAAVLCWYDVPGERLINDLDLSLHGSSGLLACGAVPAASSLTPDRSNTVECIDCTLPPGRYRLRVAGHNVMQGPQRYALAWALARPP